MSSLNKSLSKNAVCLVFLLFLLSPPFFGANNTAVKDSLLVILKNGRDKRFYKTCQGRGVKLLCSYEQNLITVLALGKGTDKPIVAGHNDIMCSPKTNILYMGVNNLLTGKSGFLRLGGIPLAGN